MWVAIDLDGVCFYAIPRLIKHAIGEYTLTIQKETGLPIIEGEFDWDRMQTSEEVITDPVIIDAPEATREIATNYDIVYITARPDSCKKGTLEALVKNGFAEGLLWMREYGDWRSSAIIKKELIIENEYRLNALIVAAIDDDYNGGLKAMYEELGIPHFYTLKEFITFLRERVGG